MAEVAIAAFIGSSLLQAKHTLEAGKIAATEGELSAKGEELAAIQREGDRKSRLTSALASQIATSGARGISAFEGSPLTILQEDIKTEKRATERDIFQSRLSALTARTRGQISKDQSKASALIGLTRDASIIAPSFPTSKKE